MSFDVFLCFAIPVVWILSALFAHRLFVRRGYPQSESWLPGCLLGPVGVFIAILVPRESPRGRDLLQVAGLFFVITLFVVLIPSIYLAAKGLPQLGVGLFIVGEVAIFFFVRRIPRRDEERFAEAANEPAQENEEPDNRLWIQSADYSSKIHPLVDANESIRMYRAHDWTKELALLSEMQAEQQDCCPPGIGFLRDDGRFLHICPDGDGRISLYFQPAHAPKSSTWTYSDLPESDAEVAIKAFHSGQDAWFKANTSYG